MNWTYETLTPAIIRDLLLNKNILQNQHGMPWLLDEIMWFVTTAHKGPDGPALTAADEEHLEPVFRSVLGELEENGLVKEVEEGRWLGLLDPDSLSEYQESKRIIKETAEVVLGDGPHSVYGWYLPAYRKLAEKEGEARFPMKVGSTTQEPFRRLKAHIGTAPEKPVLGFLLKTDHAELMEKWLHIQLRQRGQHMPDALGNEWFLTTPEELRQIVGAMAAKMAPLAEEAKD